MKETTKTKRRKSVITRLIIVSGKVDQHAWSFNRRLDTINNKMNVLMFAMALFIVIRLGDFILFMFQK